MHHPRLIGASKIPFHSKWDNKFFPSPFSIDSLELALISVIRFVYLFYLLLCTSVLRTDRTDRKATSLSLRRSVCRWTLRPYQEKELYQTFWTHLNTNLITVRISIRHIYYHLFDLHLSQFEPNIPLYLDKIMGPKTSHKHSINID